MQEVQQGEKYDQRRPKQSEIKAEISTLHVRASGRWSGTRESIMVSVAKRTAPTLSPNVQQRLAFVHQRCDCHRWVRRSNRSLASIGCSLSSRLTRASIFVTIHIPAEFSQYAAEDFELSRSSTGDSPYGQANYPARHDLYCPPDFRASCLAGAHGKIAIGRRSIHCFVQPREHMVLALWEYYSQESWMMDRRA